MPTANLRARTGRFAASLALSFFALSANAEALRLGIFPYFSPSKLVSLHFPLTQHLSTQLERPVNLVSAPSFGVFQSRTAERSYDLLITAPHLGRIAENSGYRWLAVTRNISHAVFVAHRDRSFEGIADLRHRRLSLPPANAIVHQFALQELRKAGIPPEQLTLQVRNFHDNALRAVVRGDADAAAVGSPTWERYLASGKRELEMLGKSVDIPGFAIMVHERVPEDVREQLHQALFEFAASPAGNLYFEKNALKGLREPETADFIFLDRYLLLMGSG